MLIKIPFLPWWGKADLEIEIPDDTKERFRIRAAVEIAVGRKLSLDGASLDGARLDGASLVGASLVGASLDGARLDGARLDGARLDGASLVGASLDGARLDGARLVGARLDGARLDGASLRSIKADFFLVLLGARAEVPALLSALREGRVDGSTYTGECACLVGTIANVRKVAVETLERDVSRPAERWFTGIRRGDTPATNQLAKIAEGWIVEFLDIMAAPQE